MPNLIDMLGDIANLISSLIDKPLDRIACLARSSNNLLLSFNLIPFAGIAFL